MIVPGLKEQLEEQVGICSEIINLASKLTGAAPRNTILAATSAHRMGLRNALEALEKMNAKG